MVKEGLKVWASLVVDSKAQNVPLAQYFKFFIIFTFHLQNITLASGHLADKSCTGLVTQFGSACPSKAAYRRPKGRSKSPRRKKKSHRSPANPRPAPTCRSNTHRPAYCILHATCYHYRIPYLQIYLPSYCTRTRRTFLAQASTVVTFHIDTSPSANRIVRNCSALLAAGAGTKPIKPTHRLNHNYLHTSLRFSLPRRIPSLRRAAPRSGPPSDSTIIPCSVVACCFFFFLDFSVRGGEPPLIRLSPAFLAFWTKPGCPLRFATIQTSPCHVRYPKPNLTPRHLPIWLLQRSRPAPRAPTVTGHLARIIADAPRLASL